MTKVSIIMTCNNGEMYLRDAIKSIIAQTFKKWELIFLDNNSTDNSKKILYEFKDKRIFYFKNNFKLNLGAARNLAFKKCKGDLITFLDVDDLWDKNKLMLQFKKFQNNQNIQILYTKYYILKNKKLINKKNYKFVKGKIKKDIMIYLGVCVVMIFLLWNGILERWEGILLFTGIIFYTIHSFITDKSHDEDFESAVSTWHRTILFLVFGFVLLYFGSEYFIDGAIGFAKIIGVNDLIIGMSVVALGTSLPELVTSVFAVVKKEHSISVGNILGSNLFNILSVLGLVSIITPLSVESSIFSFEIPFMIGTGLLLIPISLRQRPISKGISFSMLIGYFIFIFILFTEPML